MNARRWAACLALTAAVVGIGLWHVLVGSPSTEEPTRAPTHPQRIASLTLGTDEILSELVPQERIVCVTFLVDDPQISNIPTFYPSHIARVRDSAAERIIGLRPDLVCVAPYNSADFLKIMERSGLPCYRNESCNSIDEIEAGIIALGKRVGVPARSQELVQRMQDRRRRLADRISKITHRPRVLYWSAGFTAGRRTTMDDIIREAGGINVAAEKGLDGSAEISPEQVIAADPQFILLSHWSTDEQQGRIENHPLLRNLQAVQEKRVISIEGRYLTTVSHFVIEGAERLARSCTRMHGEDRLLPRRVP